MSTSHHTPSRFDPLEDLPTFPALTVEQTAVIAGVSTHAVRAHLKRKGEFRGIAPRKLWNGRLLFPRDRVLALSHVYESINRQYLDGRALAAVLAGVGLPTDDTGLLPGLILLSRTPPDRPDMPAESVLIQQLVSAFVQRLTSLAGSLNDEGKRYALNAIKAMRDELRGADDAIA